MRQPEDPTEPKDAEPATRQANAALAARLPFGDTQDFADARRGFILTGEFVLEELDDGIGSGEDGIIRGVDEGELRIAVDVGSHPIRLASHHQTGIHVWRKGAGRTSRTGRTTNIELQSRAVGVEAIVGAEVFEVDDFSETVKSAEVEEDLDRVVVTTYRSAAER